MKVIRLPETLPGERIVGVQPELSPQPQATWRRRLRLFAGRSLNDLALAVEQQGRAGELATRGQFVSAGVVEGLEVVLERRTVEDADASVLHLAPGYGIAASGEDVSVPVSLKLRPEQLPVYAPSELLQAIEAGGQLPVPETPGALRARRLGPALGALRAALAERATPDAFTAGVILLQPVELEERGNEVEACEDDPSAYSFEDWQLVDGCRVVFYAWPDEWLTLPARGGRWRNHLAHAVFEAEAALSEGEMLPWEPVGLPVALLAFDSEGRPAFVDRYSVVRAGGKPRHRRRTIHSRGTPFLWQARLQQFAEQLSEPLAAGDALPSVDAFRYLPPAGLLARDAVDLSTRQSRFFPTAYEVSAVPVPVEQLDAAIEASAGLQPYDLFNADAVEVLVPVPQIWFEPRLLQSDAVDPEFTDAIEEFAGRRGKWLLRRGDVRRKANAINRAIKAVDLPFPEPDPDQLEPETVAADPIDPDDASLAQPEGVFGVTVTDGGQTVDALEELRTRLRTQSPVKHESVVTVAGQITIPQALRNRLTLDASAKTLSFRGRMTAAERDLLLSRTPDEADKRAVTSLQQETLAEELSQLDELGLEGFIEFLEARIARADDSLDFGFLRAQTDIYRIRQIILGEDAATRLTTSPALASIAKGNTAAATREDLLRFFETARAPEPSAPAFGPRAITPASARTTEAAAARIPGLDLSTRLNLANRPNLSVPSVPSRAAGAGRLGDAVVQPPERSNVVFESRTGRADLFQSATTREDITSQAPIVGKAYDFRTVTIAERLAQPASQEAKGYTVSTKFEVVNGLLNLGLNTDDLQIPGFKGENNADVTVDLRDVRKGGLAAEILTGRHDPNPEGADDEVGYLTASVKALDQAVAILRIAEGRVQAYKNALVLCRTTLSTLRELASQTGQRLDVLGGELAEARHDVAVARSLLAEETARVDAINTRRSQILAEHVTFLAYRRPRGVNLLLDIPSRPLDPGITVEDIPDCRSGDVPAPAELIEMLELLKDAPAGWFRHVSAIVGLLDKPIDLIKAVSVAKTRALSRSPGLASSIALNEIEASGRRVGLTAQAAANAGSFGPALGKVVAAREQDLAQQRMVRSQIDLGMISTLNWLRVRDAAQTILSLGDLIEGNHGRGDVTRRAVQEWQDLTRVATCLYAQLDDVLPAIRLDWAQRLSEHDETVDLRNFASLPRWGEVGRLDRREIQTLVDWLYQRIEQAQPAALSFMHDLVRVCVLLASHAPVTQIVAGRVARPATIKAGERVGVLIPAAALPKLRIGMPAVLYAGATVVGHAVVEDLAGGQAVTRVLRTAGPEVLLMQDAIVHFGTANAIERNPLTAGVGRRLGGSR